MQTETNKPSGDSAEITTPQLETAALSGAIAATAPGKIRVIKAQRHGSPL